MGVRVRTPSSKDVAQVASFGLGSDWTNRDILIQNMKVGTGIQARRSLGNLGSILVGLVLFKSVDAQREPKRFQGRLGVTNSATNTGKKFKVYDDYYDYYYDDEPLPSGPTRRPEISQNSLKLADKDYLEEQPLPSGPTKEPPLPSGPTRRPGQPMTFSPRQRNTLSPALNQALTLPILTTRRPKKLKPVRKASQKKVLEQLGPFHEHFIAPPKLNAGALPLEFESSIPLSRFPPFNLPSKSTKETKS